MDDGRRAKKRISIGAVWGVGALTVLVVAVVVATVIGSSECRGDQSSCVGIAFAMIGVAISGGLALLVWTVVCLIAAWVRYADDRKAR